MPPMSAIKRIEVIRGPMSTLYGSDAMGGVINIITRPVSQTWSVTVTLEGNANQYRDAGDSGAIRAIADGPLEHDRLCLQLRGRIFELGESDRLIDRDTGRDPRPVEGSIYSLGGRLTPSAPENDAFWLDVEQSRQS